MKILAIRGENLASLAGAFEVPLVKAPLGGSGLFAITGATGAGKSTLLDALCLALFDEMPRLDGRSNVAVGRGDDDPKARLLAHDVRSILRRGTAAGFAEVDYLGRDGRRYRARWSVRRARDRVDGAYQAQQMSLLDLEAGTPLGGTKTEVLEEVRRTLGLSYQQFRRSALLAQGDFAAFLRADAEARASLLEQMTGTELYSQISVAAHRQYKEAREELRRIEAEIGAVQVLAPEARAELSGRLAALAAEKKQAEDTLEAVKAALRWYEARSKLHAEERAAIEAEQAADAAVAAGALERAELERVERAYALRPRLDAADAARRALLERAAAQERLGRAAIAAIGSRDEAAAQRAAAEEGARLSREALVAARGDLDAAARLDTQIEEAARRRDEAAQLEGAAAESAREAAEEAARVAQEIAAARERVRESADWLAESAAYDVLVAQWPRCEHELSCHAAATRDERAAGAERGAHEEAKRRADAALSAAEEAAARADEARRAAEDAWREMDAAAQREAMTPERREERERLLGRQKRLESLNNVAERAIAYAVTEAREESSAAAARAQAAEATGAATEAERQSVRLDAQRGEADLAAQRARAVQDLAAHRGKLREGESCPLCGALEHPYVAAGWPIADVLTQAEARAAELGRALIEAQKRLAASRVQVEALEKQAAEAAARARAAHEDRAQLCARWAQEAGALGLTVEQPDASGREAVGAALGVIREELEALAEAERRAAELDRRARALLDERERRRVEEAGAREKRDAARAAVLDAARRLEQSDEQRARARAEQARALAALELPLAGWGDGWQARLAEDPEGFAASCRTAVDDYNACLANRDEAEKQLATLGGQSDTAAARLAVLREIAAARAAELREAAAAVVELGAQRATLFGGKSTAEVRDALEGAAKEAAAALDRAREVEKRRTEEAAAAEIEAKSAAASVAAHEVTAREAERAFEDQLAAAGFDKDTLLSLLAHDERWIEATRAAITGRAQALVKARAVRDERVRAREAYEAAGRPAIDEEEAAARREPAAAKLEETMEAIARAQADLAHDDEARRRRADRADDLERQRVIADRWRVLDDLIGSADGKTFRVFAQSLTLEALLSHANEHLDELAPRYRLMRVPNHDLDLQIVDQDMADEIRSTASLSGGESFLVSLALALGLSSLASQDVRIETLFIDEGFGTLDPETLDTAVAALEALQAAGRQVGLISHVSGLAEQIGTEVRVERLGSGRSRVRITGASAEGQPTEARTEPAKAAPKKRTKKAAGPAA